MTNSLPSFIFISPTWESRTLSEVSVDHYNNHMFLQETTMAINKTFNRSDTLFHVKGTIGYF